MQSTNIYTHIYVTIYILTLYYYYGYCSSGYIYINAMLNKY